MLLNEPSAAHRTIIEQSSGSTVTSLGMIARVLYGNEASRAYVSNKAGVNRIRQLRFFGLNVYAVSPQLLLSSMNCMIVMLLIRDC